MSNMKLALAHHSAEEYGLFVALREVHPRMLAKMTGQHNESRELARAIHGCSAADSMYLYRRFWAISRHNIIAEDRDLFPLVSRGQSRRNDHI